MTQNNSNSNNKKLFFTDNSPSIDSTPSNSMEMENIDFFKDFWGNNSYSYKSKGKKYIHDSLGTHLARTGSQEYDITANTFSISPNPYLRGLGSIMTAGKNIWTNGWGKGITKTITGKILSTGSNNPVMSTIKDNIGNDFGSSIYDALNNFNFKASQSVPKTMEYNPTTLKYGMTDFSNSQQPSSKAWEDFLNSAKGSETTKFSKLEPAKYDLSNKPIAGVANNTGSADTTQMLVSYPAPTVSVGGNSWLSSFGSILSGTANIISAGFGIATGLGNLGGGTVTGAEPNIIENAYPTGAWDNFGNAVKFHDGGKVIVPKYKGGRNEMIAILQGGETVRTEAQENELQDSKKKDIIEAIAPLVSGDDKDDPYAQVFGKKNSKQKDSTIPVLLNKTRSDEEMIISIVAEAWRTNRSGFRNALRYS